MRGIDHRVLHAQIMARNGEIHQQIGVRKIDGKWEFAYHAYRIVDGNVAMLKQTVPSNYPRTATGEPDW